MQPTHRAQNLSGSRASRIFLRPQDTRLVAFGGCGRKPRFAIWPWRFRVCGTVLASAGATWIEYCILLVLFFALIAVEALNTAIECIVDHLASDWQEFARDAKDLGSLATMCMICANCAFIGSVIIRALAHA